MKTIDQLIAEADEQSSADAQIAKPQIAHKHHDDGKQTVFRTIGFPERHKAQIELRGSEWNAAYERAMTVVEAGGVVALIGNRGAGKTQMSWHIAQNARFANIVTHGKRDGFSYTSDRPAIYSTAMDVFIDIKSTYSPKAKMTERELMDSYEAAALLVIDEINVSSGTPFEDLKITHILDMRYKAMRPSIIIGNLTMQQLNDRLGASVVSRIIETGKIIECNWASFRTA